MQGARSIIMVDFVKVIIQTQHQWLAVLANQDALGDGPRQVVEQHHFGSTCK